MGIKYNLIAEGYRVTVSGDGRAAVKLLTESSTDIDLVVLDLMLPGMSGYAVCESLRAIDRDMPVVALVPRDSVYLKTVSNVEEIKARQGRLVLIGTSGDDHLTSLTEDVLYMPEVNEELNPLLYTIPAQLLAYEIACRRGCDVDQPRNLAKSVTVE